MAKKSSEREASSILVIGLGRFGSATAEGLMSLGREVMAIERSPEVVQQWTGRLTHVVEADSTNIEALRQVGAEDFTTAVVGIGTSIEASVLTTANLVDLGISQVWAKAISNAHGKILRRIGAEHVLFPESEAGARVAHLVSSRMLDYIEFDEGHFAVVKMRPPKEVQGFTLGESRIRDTYGVTVVGVKSPGRDFTYAEPSTRIGAQDVLIVAGNVELLGRFAGRP
ncbi:TrkA family potassium uptake protein [Brevibacterium sp. 5221]|uniref:TrkA family potassium uptake protein n=1 Tax=Brevibacterium rongguiense TaxID=2695267 RepID=A0A6N9H7B6_9MICO|nr:MULTISPECIES: TrkA family potassium uptake protein [Brevibacterium]MYM19920.1 TrkA family potassium uptake protein [Brevibacterium rongguiense]WAL39069.1 TrkA family potassium uptake protein [Brevibacterium sp. BRM-1]